MVIVRILEFARHRTGTPIFLFGRNVKDERNTSKHVSYINYFYYS